MLQLLLEASDYLTTRHWWKEERKKSMEKTPFPVMAMVTAIEMEDEWMIHSYVTSIAWTKFKPAMLSLQE